MTDMAFPPIRACIFDMDGLLLDTEDIATQCHANVLAKYGKPALPSSIKAQVMGRAGPSARQILFDWAKLPISDKEYQKEVSEFQKVLFKGAMPLPCIPELLHDLTITKKNEEEGGVVGGA